MKVSEPLISVPMVFPGLITISPGSSFVRIAAPVLKIIEPVDPALDVPVVIKIAPLDPATPAFLVPS